MSSGYNSKDKALPEATALSDRLEAKPDACHGKCYGFEKERASWAAPLLIARSEEQARPGYDSMTASEFQDDGPVLKAKVRILGELIRKAKCCILYSGAGLSTGAGIGDYASQSSESASGVAPPSRTSFLSEIQSRCGLPSSAPPASTLKSPLCAQPTSAHRALVALHKAGYLHRWINQNHDGLPQKAGLPQECINEIHGAWHAPDNPVIPMSGGLREDLFADLLECEEKADLSIAVGTSLCGMNADRVITTPASKAGKDGVTLGSVIISLQQTVNDEDSSLRIFARCDDVFELLAEELKLDPEPAWPPGEYFVPQILADRAEDNYLFPGISYDASGCHSGKLQLDWDLRDDVQLVIPRGMHAGATGVIDGFDREGNVRCRFTLKPKQGKLRAPVMLLLGRWWIQAAVDGTVPTLPVVNVPSDSDMQPAAQHIRKLMEAYAGP